MNRWKVERFFVWLNNFRRLATRFERLCMMHLVFYSTDLRHEPAQKRFEMLSSKTNISVIR